MWATVLQQGLSTGLAPAQQIDTSKNQMLELEKTDNTVFIVLLIVALLAAAGTIYFITK